MVTRLFLVYALTELTVLVALTSVIGFGWTLLVLLATFAAGVVVAGAQAGRQLTRLRAGLITSRGAVTDGALVALGTIMVAVPGLVSTAAGVLLLLPTRVLARPLLTAVAAKTLQGLGRGAPVVTAPGAYPAGGRGDFIDGEVIDVTDVPPPPAGPAATP
jgi:UPF0716 protein FxsA